MPPDPSAPTEGDRLRVLHMLACAQDARAILGALDADALAADMLRTRAIMNCFSEIGEAARRLSAPARALCGDLPWRQIVGLRNVVVHVYWTIDVRELVKTTREDLPMLIAALERALAAWPS